MSAGIHAAPLARAYGRGRKQVRRLNKSQGVSREMVMIASGFCTGLAFTDRFSFDDHERRILKAAGDALLVAGQKLKPFELLR